MATTTPNYGWDVPTSTDYVKDGATAIETLGDDIDATLYTINGGVLPVGLQQTLNQNFTSVSSLLLSNVFVNDGQYKIIVQEAGTVSHELCIRFVNSGGTLATGYNFAAPGASGTGTTSNDGASSVTYMRVGGFDNNFGARNYSSMELDNTGGFPRVLSHGMWAANGASAISRVYGGFSANSNNITGLSVFPSTGNFTGNIKIYKYRSA